MLDILKLFKGKLKEIPTEDIIGDFVNLNQEMVAHIMKQNEMYLHKEKNSGKAKCE